MTISPQGGDGCNGSNENQSRIERQLEWSRHIGINELKRIYGASLFLKCIADLFHLLALLALCIGVTPVFLYSSCPYRLAKLGLAPILMEMNPNAELYPVWTLLCIVVMILAQYLKRLKMPSLCRIIISMLQIGLAAASGYFFCIQAIYYIVFGGYDIYYVWDHFCLPFIVFFFLYLLLEANYAMLGYSRSRQARIFAVVLSLVWGIAGLSAMIILPIFPAVAAVWGLLMVGVFWIAAFSKIRHQLFRTDALSHKQLYAVLKQKKRGIPNEELFIQEDHKDISRNKYLQKYAWIFLAVQIIAAFLVFFVQSSIWFLHKAAELGCTQAQLCLARGYSHGIGVEKNEAQSVKWFRKAAEQGIAEAQFSLAQSYSRGIGVKKNDAEAIKWYLKSAEQGIAEAKLRLGLCYADGIGVRQDYAEAMKWYRKAAEQGHKKAQFELGLFYAAGRGVRQNYTEAMKWYHKAAEQQNTALKKKYSSIAALELAEIYIILEEYDRAVACLDDTLWQDQNTEICCLRSYLKACALLAKRNNAEAEIRRFNHYFDLRAKKKLAWDVSAFRFWLKRAKLSSFARQSIAKLTNRFRWEMPYENFHYGNFKWMSVSAELGDDDTFTQYRLGVYYANGWGVMPDYAEAVKWYSKAVDSYTAKLKEKYHPITALKLAELYIALGDYDRAISYLDDSRLQQNLQYGCFRAYLKACALLAKGNDAGTEIQRFYEYLPGLGYKWGVEALSAWMRKASLSDQARKTISEMTDRVACGK